MFYFLFSVIIIPFQVVIDIFSYNFMTYYLQFDFLHSLKKWNIKFKNGGENHFWRGFDKVNLKLEAKLRPLEQLSFSSQFYFLSVMALAGNLFTIIGVMIVLETKTNPFIDILMVVFIAINHIILLCLKKFFLWLRGKLKLWENKKSDKNQKQLENFNQNSSSFLAKNQNNESSLKMENLQVDLSMKKNEGYF